MTETGTETGIGNTDRQMDRDSDMDRSRIQKGNLRAVIEVQEEIISFFRWDTNRCTDSIRDLV